MVTRYSREEIIRTGGDLSQMEESLDGRWVRYEEHEEIVARLSENIGAVCIANKELADKIMDVMQENEDLKQAHKILDQHKEVFKALGEERQMDMVQQIMEEDKEILTLMGNDKPYCAKCHKEIKANDGCVCDACSKGG